MGVSNIGKFDVVGNIIDSVNVSDAVNQNNTIADTNLIESNQKAVNDIYLKSLAIGKQPDSMQIVQLTEIAYQKPYIGGNAVYSARAILRLDINDIERTIQNKNLNVLNNPNKEIDCKLYPNPAKDEVIVDFYGELPKDLFIELFDLLGNKVETQNLKENITKISTIKQNSGVYYFRIINNNELIKSGKLVIIK